MRDETVKERLQSIEKQLREVIRGVQLIRDKQVCGLYSGCIYTLSYKHTCTLFR